VTPTPPPAGTLGTALGDGVARLASAGPAGLLRAAGALAAALVIVTRVLPRVVYPGSRSIARDRASRLPLPPRRAWLPPLVGDLGLLVSSARLRLAAEMAARYRGTGVVQSFVIGFGTFFFATDKAAAQEVEAAGATADWPPATKDILGHSSLIVLQNDRHRAVRRMMLDALGPRHVAACAPDMARIAREKLSELADRGGGGSPLRPELALLSTRIVLECIVGVRLKSHADLERIVEATAQIPPSIFAPTQWWAPGHHMYRQGLAARATILESFRPLVRAARRAADGAAEGGRHGSDSEQAGQGGRGGGAEAPSTPLMEHGWDGAGIGRGYDGPNFTARMSVGPERLSEDELMDQLVLLLFAGADTTVTSMTNLLALLAHHPKWVARLRQEQDELAARHGPEVTGDVLSEMPVATAVMREAWRLLPPVGGGVRRAGRTTEVNGVQVPAGSKVVVSLPAVHAADVLVDTGASDMAPEDRHSPEERARLGLDPFGLPHLDALRGFRPERWLGEEGFPRPKHYVPFGFGPRSCIGMNFAMGVVRAFLAVLVREFEFEVTDRDLTLKPLDVMTVVGTGCPAVVTRRTPGAQGDGRPAASA